MAYLYGSRGGTSTDNLPVGTRYVDSYGSHWVVGPLGLPQYDMDYDSDESDSSDAANGLSNFFARAVAVGGAVVTRLVEGLRTERDDDTRDDGYSDDEHADEIPRETVIHDKAVQALERAAESSPIKSGTKGRSLFLSLRGGREAVLALMKQWHPDLLGRMKLKKDGFPDARHHVFKTLMKVLGQYVPIFTKTSEAAARKALTSGCSEAAARALKKLKKSCRTYKVLTAAGIDFDKMSLSESQQKIKMLQDSGADKRLTATLRLAHSVKWYDSLVDDEKPGGHVNTLLHLSGLKTLEQRERDEDYRQSGTVVRIKKNYADGTEYAFVNPGNMFLHPKGMRAGEKWVRFGDLVKYSVGRAPNGKPTCVDAVQIAAGY